MRPSSKSSSGMVSFLFLVLIAPILFMLLTVTIEFSNFFGIRDELQRVIDREAHDALTMRTSATQVESNIRNRMENIRGMATLSTVSSTLANDAAEISASAQFQGAFFQLAQRFLGQPESFMPIEVRSRVRVQSSASLIIVDRRVPATGDVCADSELQAALSFVDGLVESWTAISGARVAVAVTPGTVEAVELLSIDASDSMPRCRPKSSSTLFDAGGLAGAPVALGDAYDVALNIQELASPAVFSPSVEGRNIVFVMRQDEFNEGYSSMTYNLVDNAARSVALSVDMFSVIVNGGAGIPRRPFQSGENGASLREIEASESELRGARLVSVIAKNVNDRMVLER